MQAVERAGWQNPKVLTTLLMVFVAGAFTGALSMRLGLHRILHNGSSTQNWSNPNMAKLFLDRCDKDLKLSPKQREEMRSILDDYKSYYENVQEQLEDVRATGKKRILAVLDPQQRQKFEQLLNEPPKLNETAK